MPTVFGRAPEPDDEGDVASVGGTVSSLDEIRYRIDGIHNALGQRVLGTPMSTERAVFAKQLLTEFSSIAADLDSWQATHAYTEDVAALREDLLRDCALVEEAARSTEADGIHPSMTWAEGFRRLETADLAKTLINEISGHLRADQDDPLAAVFHMDGPYRRAEEFARRELGPRVDHLLQIATTFTSQVGLSSMEELYPGFDPRSDDPPAGFYSTVQGLIQGMAPALFQLDAAYITDDLTRMLAPVYAYTVNEVGGELGARAMHLTVIDVLFVRGQLPPLAEYGASLPRGSFANEALMRTTAILMSAASGAGLEKIPRAYQANVDALRFYVDAFMNAVNGRLQEAL